MSTYCVLGEGQAPGTSVPCSPPWERRPDVFSGGRCRGLSWREGTQRWPLRCAREGLEAAPHPPTPRTAWACPRRPRACAVGPVGAPRPFHVLSRLFAASCASYSFSFLSPQGLSLAAQGPSAPFWSGTAALGAWGPGAGSLRAHPACGCPSGGGAAGQAGLLHPRPRQACRCPHCCAPRHAHPTAPPQLLGHRPRCSRRALPLAAADSQAATLGGGQTRGPPQRCPRGGGTWGPGAGSRWPTTRPSLRCQSQSPPRRCACFSLCRGRCHLSIRTPGSRGAGPAGVPVWGPGRGS